MPWREKSPMALRQEFVWARLRRDRPMAALYEEFGVSRKTGWLLEKTYPAVRWPAPGTVGEVLRRQGLVDPAGRGRRRRWTRSGPLREAKAPNDVGAIDFKGWFRTRDGVRRDPLTVTDLCSQFTLLPVIVPIQIAAVRRELEKVFEHYGAPGALRSDHGTPGGAHFGSRQ